MKGFWIAGWVFGSMMVLSAFSTGCGLSECTDDPTTAEDECAEVYILPGEDGEPETREEGGESSAEEEFGCELDGMCNFLCVDVEGTPRIRTAIPMCRERVSRLSRTHRAIATTGDLCVRQPVNVPALRATAIPIVPILRKPLSRVGPTCIATRGAPPEPIGTVQIYPRTESTVRHLETRAGEAEPEEPESMNEEGGDERTDSCDESVGFCDAVEGTVEACPVDPDCDGILFFPCEGDGYCDGKCADGSDPDCE